MWLALLWPHSECVIRFKWAFHHHLLSQSQLFSSISFSASTLCCFHLPFLLSSILANVHVPFLHLPPFSHYPCFVSPPSPQLSLSLVSPCPPICRSFRHRGEVLPPSQCLAFHDVPLFWSLSIRLSSHTISFFFPIFSFICVFFFPKIQNINNFFIIHIHPSLHPANESSSVPLNQSVPYSSRIKMLHRQSLSQDKLTLQVTVYVPADKNQSAPQDTSPFVVFFFLLQALLVLFSITSIPTHFFQSIAKIIILRFL